MINTIYARPATAPGLLKKRMATAAPLLFALVVGIWIGEERAYSDLSATTVCELKQYAHE